MIGVNALVTPETGLFECSRFDWGLDAHAMLAPAEGTLTVHEKYGEPFAGRQALPFSGVGAAHKGASDRGAFVIRTQWRMRCAA